MDLLISQHGGAEKHKREKSFPRVKERKERGELSGVDNYCYVIKPPLLNLAERRDGCKCADRPPQL